MRGVVTSKPSHGDKQQICPFCHGTGIATPRIDPEEQLIREIAAYVGARTFNVHELMAYALVIEGPSAGRDRPNV